MDMVTFLRLKSIFGNVSKDFVLLAFAICMGSPSFAAIYQTEMTGFQIQTCGISGCIRAKGVKADTSSLTSLIAARNVQLEISLKDAEQSQIFDCASFTFDFRDSNLACEIERSGQPQTITWAPNGSGLHRYPRN